MAVMASASVTLSTVVDVKATYRYYLLQSSTLAKPSAPTAYPPASLWTDTEPKYTSGSTNSLYFVDCTVFCDDTFAYSAVSLSSSYEAAKEAYNKAVNAQNAANSAQNTANEVKADAIVSTVEQFYQSNSATALSGGSWTNNQPTWTAGKYIWRRTFVTYGDGTTAYTPSSTGVCITGNTGAQGEKGDTGETGPKGDTGATGPQGVQGYSIVTSVSRPSFTEAQWETYGTIGRSENWTATESIRNGCRIGDIFTVVGTATDTGKAHVLYFRSSTASGTLYGECIAHSVAERGATGATGPKGDTGATGATGPQGPQGAAGADGQMLYATCGTAAATAAKVATLASGTLALKSGATVAVKFTYANSASSPTLNIANTGAKQIRVNGAAMTSSAYYWVANAVVTFVYDGIYWNVADASALSKASTANTNATNAAKTATNFMSYDSTNGLQVGNKSSGSWSGYRTKIKSDSFNIVDADDNEIASYGANTIEIGKNNRDTEISFCNDGLNISYDAEHEDMVMSSDSLRLKGETYVSMGSQLTYTENGVVKNLVGSIDISPSYASIIVVNGEQDEAGETSGIAMSSGIDIADNSTIVTGAEFIRLNSSTIAAEGDVGVEGDLDIVGNAYMGNQKSIYMTNGDGNVRNVLHTNSINELALGYGGYNSSDGSTIVYGNEVYLRSRGAIAITSPTAGLSARHYGVNKVLWSGGAYMSSGQTATLSEGVSAQPHGIILVFSQYSGGSQNAHFTQFFVPKSHVAAHGGAGSVFLMFRHTVLAPCTKYLYINNTTITGHANNTYNGVANTASGIKWEMDAFVLRYVYGV